ncbi:MAG TPA: hypothetical protein VGI75_02155, partial [Pirellulales bacterium]
MLSSIRLAQFNSIVLASLFLILIIATGANAADPPKKNEAAAATNLPLLLDEDFSHSADRWAPASKEGWKLIDTDDGKVFSEFKNIDIGKKLPHRSPWNIALLKDAIVGDFVL